LDHFRLSSRLGISLSFSTENPRKSFHWRILLLPNRTIRYRWQNEGEELG
jgi:hypothetical protein